MSSNLPEPIPTYPTVLAACLACLIPLLWALSLINGVDPFGCPPGTKTISSPTSIESWCLEE
jgi:hypothetical protein